MSKKFDPSNPLGAGITIYKVCIPSAIAWPDWKVTLKVFFTKEHAEKYVEDYPNILIRPFLSVEEENIRHYETD